MSTSHVNVDQWTDMFRHVGLTEQQMTDWHVAFERRHPEAHQAFLEWLGLPPDRIDAIRREHGS